MLKSAFQKLVGGKTAFETYVLLRLQAKTYRLVKNYVAPILEQHHLSTLDWSLLGLLKEYPEGCRFIAISQQMGVEPPFITELVTAIKKQGVITIKEDPQDRRAKILLLTTKGEDLVRGLEEEMQKKLEGLFDDVSVSEFQTYLHFMEKMIHKIGETGKAK